MTAPDTPPPPAAELSQPRDPTVPLCEVLEQELTALTGQPIEPSYDWRFTAEQILDPVRLAARLRDGKDRASRRLARGQFAPLVERLLTLGPDADPDVLRAVLTEHLNNALLEPGLYSERIFAGIRFRSQTLDYLEVPCSTPGSCPIRNRLILEDTFFELEKMYDRRLKAVYAKVHRTRLTALCLSGGGIRSATFGLGVVEGLARYGILDQFHYLSTVSGGGYLGGWLSAWIRYAGLPEVVRQLATPTGRPLEPEPTPVWHLRTYSNYLSPRLGLLSADSWTLIATYLRNLFLTWLVLLPPAIGALSAPVALATIVAWAPSGFWGWLVQRALTVCFVLVAFAWAIRAIAYVHANRPVPKQNTERSFLVDTRRSQAEFLHDCLWPLVGSVVLIIVCWAWVSRHVIVWPHPWLFAAAFGALGGLVHLIGWKLGRDATPDAPIERHEGAFIAVTGLMAGLAVSILASSVAFLLMTRLGSDLYIWLSVPALLILILLFSHIYIGYTSSTQVDAVREWSARFSAWLLIVAVAWFGIVGLVLLGPEVVRLLVENQGQRAVRIGQIVSGIVGVISGLVTLRAGHSAGTPATQRPAGTPMNLPLLLAAPVFVVFLVGLFGWAGRALIGTVESLATQLPVIGPESFLTAPDWVRPSLIAIAGGVSGALRAVMKPGAVGYIVTSIVVPLILIWFGSWTATRVDTNKFSLHAMYRARLIRAYLGASRPAGERDPNPFTGFDPLDNIWMKDLWPPPGAPFIPPGPRLMHVVNVALNLVGGGNLAWQQRKAESFTFSPLYCGAYNQGYRPTRRPKDDRRRSYGGADGITLGTAMTISGAAVSPNMGYHSSTVISFLMTLFNVRLGWWLGNPGHAGAKVYEQSSPDSSLRLILDEAQGHTDNKHPYVYLSDGGHFENLGLYEMILRRCHTIVVSDAGCDPSGSFEDLGNAIRKIRVDFGIPIEFQEIKIYPRVPGEPPTAGKYCAIGTIRYSCVDNDADDGTLIYIKPAFYGTEPKDVFNYAQTSSAFPHESTADQFFSESQFESYRALGSHAIDQILGSQPTGVEPQFTPIGRLVRRAGDYVRQGGSA